jgi:hypothetical protein
MNWEDEAYLRRAEDGRFIPIVCSYAVVVPVWNERKLTESLLGGVQRSLQQTETIPKSVQV